ncbi:MAG: PrgI family protein [Patescibacteria group bacterium]|nr:PrgI family protein [Patescibacteria group bacterium]MDE2015157.1 PrgI family protein [Patescibacteria group bacterium]MDE2226585.1 PrgI family protein [Patescibacteria group bacterium]
MQFQVPQFIQTEDKLVGPFTIKQFVYVGSAGILSFLLYFTVQPWLFAMLSIFLVGGSLALAFIRVEGRALPSVVLSAFGFYWKPQVYVWQPENPETVKGSDGLGVSGNFSLENIVSGAALRSAWKNLQSGTKVSNQQFMQKVDDQYQIFQHVTGDREAARRIDYR